MALCQTMQFFQFVNATFSAKISLFNVNTSLLSHQPVHWSSPLAYQHTSSIAAWPGGGGAGAGGRGQCVGIQLTPP